MDGKLTTGFLKQLQGMKAKVENISDEEIAEKFADIDAGGDSDADVDIWKFEFVDAGANGSLKGDVTESDLPVDPVVVGQADANGSAGFEIVNIKLILNWLKTTGLPGDIIALITICLNIFYLDIKGEESYQNNARIVTRSNPTCNLCLSTIWYQKDYKLCKWKLHHEVS